MIRTNNRPAASAVPAAALRAVALAIAALGWAVAPAEAQTHSVDLVAAPFYKTVALPNGTSVTVPMWGYGLSDTAGVLLPGQVVSSPGPRIDVPAGATTLEVVLHNQLPVPTSFVIPGQAFTAAPVVVGGRVVSMTQETNPLSSSTYTFNNLKPGTFLYQSGSHQAVQIQMGLYGAVTQDADAVVDDVHTAYEGVTFDSDVVLVYSEIDRWLHQSVADGTYGTPGGPTSTIDYYPTLFLINGESYANAAATPAIPAGDMGQNVLLRFLNAGLRTHVPVLDNGSLSIVAEDGNEYPFARPQAAMLLAAGKTHDALWTPATAGLYTVYDRSLSLNAPGAGEAGMLAKLSVSAASPASGPAPPVAGNDAFTMPEDGVLSSTVATNDGGGGVATSYALVTSTGAGVLTAFSTATGAFSYVPQANFYGVDSFTYRAVNLGGSSLATVIIQVTPLADAPVALAQAAEVKATESVPLTLGGTDADGDALTFYLTSLPANGVVSRVDPFTFALHALGPADLRTGPSNGTAIPKGMVVYAPNVTPTPPFTNPFAFVASDNAGVTASSSAVVTVTVHPLVVAADGLTSLLSLSVVGPNGLPIGGGYRWTLEEDRTYNVQPGVNEPDTLSVSFHASYMPVKRSGDETTLSDLQVDPTKRYFVSVLPKTGPYTNGGAPVAIGQTAVTVKVNSGPMPTAQIRVRVFRDNAPLNGAWDTIELGLPGFAVGIEDAGGRYGMSASQQLMDAFGNQIGTEYAPCPQIPGPPVETCESYEVATYGNGFVLSDDDGWAVIKNLAPGKYGVKVTTPGGTTWQQTATIEGSRVVDAWVKANEPAFFAEFGPPGGHAEIGFTEPTNTIASLPGLGNHTISGQVTNLRHSRPPSFQMFSGAPFDFTRPWVALNTGAVGGTMVYAQPTDEEGNFSIAGVPNGTYQLVIFDSALNVVIANKVLNTTGLATPIALGEVPVQHWNSRLYNYVFEDTNENGFRDPGEAGIPEQAINVRWRDGSMYQSFATDLTGFVPFEQVFPFFNWLVAEVDFTRFKATGATVVVDAGGDATNTNWPAQVGAEVDAKVLNPQPQTDNGGAAFRTETGPVLLEAFQGFIGQSQVLLWGKAPYAPAPGSPGSQVPELNAFPFDGVFPGAGDIDTNANGSFDGDQFHGGVSGIVHYSTVRAENDPRWGGAEVWEPGIAGVTVQLWSADRTRLLNEVTTDSWDDSLPTGCQGPAFSYLGSAKDCYDGLRNYNQVRPGVFDGGYAFLSVLEPTNAASPTANWLTPVAARGAGFREVPIQAGKYVVRVVPPRGYKVVKEEDKNVDFGDEYIPQQFYVSGYPLGDGGATTAPPKAGAAYEPLAVPFCVGSQHQVPAELALYPGVPGAYAGDQRPTCDQKLVTLRNGQNPGANFFLFTEAPIAGHIVGFVLDDAANEFDPSSPQFGEKYAPPFMPISIRDWTGREITSTFTDAYGRYNVLVPSTFTANQPIPSGMSPSMLTACINSPTIVTPAGLTVPNPHHQSQYTHFCYTLQYMPGTTTYLDTPVLPTGAFTSNGGAFPVDAELPSGTPVIAKVTNAANVNGTTLGTTGILPDSDPLRIGPYIVDRTTVASTNNLPGTRTIDITSGGQFQVPNPAYDGVGGTQPKTILRDYSFGTALNRIVVRLGGTVLSSVTLGPAGGVPAGVLRVVVPRLAVTDQLTVERCHSLSITPCSDWRKSVLGVTLTVAKPTMHTDRPPVVKTAAQTIQQAVDLAPTGALVLVRPGIYEESVVMRKPVRLQGWGALSTVINAVNAPAEKLQTWRDSVAGLLNGPNGPDYLTGVQTAILGAPVPSDGLAAALGGEAPGVMVFGRLLPITTNGTGRCLQSTAQNTATVSLTNEAYCLQNEGSVQSNTTVVARANARIDGFSMIGAMNASGIMVNANARSLDIGNNRITNNVGDFAGGIRVGHVGLPVPPFDLVATDEHARNIDIVIHNNLVGQNAGLDAAGGGGVVIGTGASNYQVVNNFIAGNFTGGHGAGIAHIGRSPNGWIDRNTIVFNEGFNQGVGRSGGGIFIGGRPVAAADVVADTPTGSGDVRVTNNLIQGNHVASGDGGGVALEGVNAAGGLDDGNRSRVALYNNMIVNNVAGLAGGGVSLHDASYVEIIHNTIVRNDSMATAGGAFVIGAGDTSTPQPAGIVARGNSYGSLNGSSFSNPTIINSIVWQNRSFYFGQLPGGVQNGPNTYGILVSPAGTGAPGSTGGRASCVIGSVTFRCWDFGGGATATSTVVTSTAASPGTNNTQVAPLFVASYVNASRNPLITNETTTIQAPVAFDEGGTFIRPIYGPLALQNPAGLALYGNYHVTTGVDGVNVSVSAAARAPLLFDIDGHARATNLSGTTLNGPPDRGADEKTADPAPGSANGIAPVITLQPASQTIPSGTTATLGIIATGDAPLVYQWYQGLTGQTSNPVGTNSASFTTPTLTAVTYYWVNVTNAAGVASSSTAVITPAAPVAPAITTHPASQTIASGATATLSVVATGTPPLSYQWYQGSSGVTTTPVGTNSSSYITAALTTTANYWVRVTNLAGSVNSNTAVISVMPAITTQPASQTIASGATATLSVVATGTAPLSYQWYQGLTGITTTPVGTNSSSYTTPALTATTSYWVRVTNAAGVANSNTATITVMQLYFSTAGDTAVPGVAVPYDNADIYLWNGTAFSRVIDATAITNPIPLGANVDGFVRVSANQFYVSFTSTTALPGLGSVEDEDIVFYNAGAWSLYFDGSDVGLGGGFLLNENVDAFALLADGSLVVSTDGASVPGVLLSPAEDLIRCVGTFGPATTCTWSVYFDGSAVGLTAPTENIDGVRVTPAGIYLSTTGTFTTTSGLTGGGANVFLCASPTTGAATSCSTLTHFFQPGPTGLIGNIDAFWIP